MKNKILACLFATTVLASVPAAAQTVAQNDDEIWSFGANLASEYRFRGISVSNSDPALQGHAEVSLGGLTVGAWGSTISERFTGGNVEVDLYAAYGFDLSDTLTLSVGGTAYTYHGVSGLDYLEANVALGADLGVMDVSTGFAYVPSQDNTGDADNIYWFADGSVPIPSLPFDGIEASAFAHLGYEDGAFDFGYSKWDYEVGVDLSFTLVDLRVSYGGTNLDFPAMKAQGLDVGGRSFMVQLGLSF